MVFHGTQVAFQRWIRLTRFAPYHETRSPNETDMTMNEPGVSDRFSWPSGARAAVSLTYDDAVPTQRGAARTLEQLGLRGTFFLTGTAPDLDAHRDAWRGLLDAGHELASHTMHHPCDCSHDWVPRGYTTQDYDLARMAEELDQTLALLRSLGARPPYTFAYPCGETHVGKTPQSYVSLVRERFLAARGVEPRVADPLRDPLSLVPAHDGAKSPRELIELVERAVENGGWLVLLFHGVGGDHLPVEREAHTALAEYLARQAGRVWTEPFGGVAAHVRDALATGLAQ
jgi:peptidoglycan/xylan/chitin deacetylase (PgdA/CDA1 family)